MRGSGRRFTQAKLCRTKTTAPTRASMARSSRSTASSIRSRAARASVKSIWSVSSGLVLSSSSSSARRTPGSVRWHAPGSSGRPPGPSRRRASPAPATCETRRSQNSARWRAGPPPARRGRPLRSGVGRWPRGGCSSERPRCGQGRSPAPVSGKIRRFESALFAGSRRNQHLVLSFDRVCDGRGLFMRGLELRARSHADVTVHLSPFFER